MLDDKDDFGRDYEPGYCAMARGQVQYWFFEWTPYFAFERNKKPHLEVKDFIKYFGPCIDHELVLKGILPYSCSRPFNWEKCEKHVGR